MRLPLMVVLSQIVINKKMITEITKPKFIDEANHLNAFLAQIKSKSDKLMNQFLIGYFLVGLMLAPFYDTWLVAIGVGGLSLVAYYSVKMLLPGSTLYQYVL